jgi:adenine/guanine phosphoribosyltransferase-like PRPP-binding protein
MDYVVWLPAIILSIIVLGTYIKFRHEVLDSIHGLQDLKLFTTNEELRRRVQVPLLRVPSGAHQVSGPLVRAGAEELGRYVGDLGPDWIVGVNLGGRLLSAYVADLIKFPRPKCLFMRRSDDNRTMAFVEQREQTSANWAYNGNMLVIDDISRTGGTFEAIRSVLVGINYTNEFDLRRVYFATLIEVLEPHSLRVRPDWSWRYTDERYNIRFPWSMLGLGIVSALRRKGVRPRLNLDEKDYEILAEYQRIGSDFEYALATAKRFIPG